MSEEPALFTAIDAFLSGCRTEAKDAASRAYWRDHAAISQDDIRLLAGLGRTPFCRASYATLSRRPACDAGEFLDALASIGLLSRCDDEYTVTDAALIYCRTVAGGDQHPNAG